MFQSQDNITRCQRRSMFWQRKIHWSMSVHLNNPRQPHSRMDQRSRLHHRHRERSQHRQRIARSDHWAYTLCLRDKRRRGGASTMTPPRRLAALPANWVDAERRPQSERLRKHEDERHVSAGGSRARGRRHGAPRCCAPRTISSPRHVRAVAASSAAAALGLARRQARRN